MTTNTLSPAEPWQTSSSPALLRDYFYPQHVPPDPYSPPPTDKRQRAINKVNLWQFKTSHLPHAVLATQALTEAVLHDEIRERELVSRSSAGAGLEEGWDGVSESAVKSVYAFAWVRFVNGFVDRDVSRKVLLEEFGVSTGMDGTEDDDELGGSGGTGSAKVKGGGENSMYANAVALGMPGAFVDLRHRVSHGDLPRLDVLRKMSAKGLEWLWERWWKRVAKGDPGPARRKEEEREKMALRARERWGDVVKQSREQVLDFMAEGRTEEDVEELEEEDDAEFEPEKTTSKKRKR